MILQNDPRIKNKWIHKEGCASLSVLWYLNKKHGLPMSPELIDAYIQKWEDHGCYDENMDLDWIKAFQVFGVKVVKAWKDTGYQLQPGEYAIGEWYNPETGLTHFTAVDGSPRQYICTYDPLGESVTVRQGYLKSLRVIREAA